MKKEVSERDRVIARGSERARGARVSEWSRETAREEQASDSEKWQERAIACKEERQRVRGTE